jgi:hypothetical protein
VYLFFPENFIKHIWSASSEDVALAILTIEWETFQKIEEREVLNLNWKRLRFDRPSMNVLEMIARFNNVKFRPCEHCATHTHARPPTHPH